jgi:hypothetical protein
MPRPKLSEAVKYQRECDKVSKTVARKLFSKVKKDFKKTEHVETVMRRKAERVVNKKVRVVSVSMDNVTQASYASQTPQAGLPTPQVGTAVSSRGLTQSLPVSTGFMFSGLPNDILRDIYTSAIVLRNEDKKKGAARDAALEVIDHLMVGCDDRTSYAFSSSDKMSIMESCLGWVRQDGSGKHGSLSFRHGGHTRFYIKKFDGEYKIDYISMEDVDEFGKMVVEYIMKEFNCAHVLVNKRRPTSAWVKIQLLTKTIEEISKETNISVYRLSKIIQ